MNNQDDCPLPEAGRRAAWLDGLNEDFAMVRAEEAAVDPVVERVRAKMRERSRVGMAKYGATLDRGDLTARDWLAHLQEELMDAVNYAEVLIGREPTQAWSVQEHTETLARPLEPGESTIIANESSRRRWVVVDGPTILTAALARMTAEADKLRAERDAILAWAALHAGELSVDIEENGEAGNTYSARDSRGEWHSGPTLEAAIRKAAGLEPQPEEPRP